MLSWNKRTNTLIILPLLSDSFSLAGKRKRFSSKLLRMDCQKTLTTTEYVSLFFLLIFPRLSLSLFISFSRKNARTVYCHILHALLEYRPINGSHVIVNYFFSEYIYLLNCGVIAFDGNCNGIRIYSIRMIFFSHIVPRVVSCVGLTPPVYEHLFLLTCDRPNGITSDVETSDYFSVIVYVVCSYTYLLYRKTSRWKCFHQFFLKRIL